MSKFVYHFSEGDKDQKELLGGKGANLAEMSRLGLPVPPGFTITTDACREFLRVGQVPAELRVQVTLAVREIEDALGRRLGDFHEPLLVSVRSGAKFSMPGMMDTVLNVGLNDASVQGLTEFTGDARFAWDSYRRLIQMFGKTVLGIDGDLFAEAFDALKADRQVVDDVELSADDLRDLVDTFKVIVREGCGREFPQHPREQLDMAIETVFRSWNTDRAILYRRQEGISGELGTAVNVQTMVFGNLGESSGTGVCFTRDPSTALECQAARLAAGRRNPAVFVELASQFAVAVDLLDGDGPDQPAYFQLVADLDTALDEAMASPHLLRALTALRAHVARARRLSSEDRARLVLAANEHRLIAQAVAAGDGVLAGQATAVHLRSSLANILATLAAEPTLSSADQRFTDSVEVDLAARSDKGDDVR